MKIDEEFKFKWLENYPLKEPQIYLDYEELSFGNIFGWLNVSIYFYSSPFYFNFVYDKKFWMLYVGQITISNF